MSTNDPDDVILGFLVLSSDCWTRSGSGYNLGERRFGNVLYLSNKTVIRENAVLGMFGT
jgi:hypothetical protein